MAGKRWAGLDPIVNKPSMSDIQLQYPSRKGYTKRELGYLAICLGFPSTLFANGFESSPTMLVEHDRLISGKRVSESAVMQLLDSKTLAEKLDKVFNKYPTKCNIKLIKKAMSLLKRKSLSFKVISEARIAFELYVCEDASGLPADLQTVMTALQMLERVMAQSRLGAEIQRYQEYSDVPGRFQMYEFFDLVVMCDRGNEIEIKMKLSYSPDDSRGNTDLSLPDFDQLLMTTDQKIAKYLNDQYRASLYRQVEPTPAVLDTEHIIGRSFRKSIVSLSREQSHAISRPLEWSVSQVNRARSGHFVLTDEQYSAPSSRRPTPTSKPGPISIPQYQYGCGPRALKFRFQRLPRALPVGGRIPLQAPQVRTFPSSSEEECRFDCAINDICVESVIRAREAVISSLESACYQPLEIQDTDEAVNSSQMLLQSPQPRYNPVVSQHEVEVHQGLMDNLQWRTLRRQSENAKRIKV